MHSSRSLVRRLYRSTDQESNKKESLGLLKWGLLRTCLGPALFESRPGRRGEKKEMKQRGPSSYTYPESSRPFPMLIQGAAVPRCFLMRPAAEASAIISRAGETRALIIVRHLSSRVCGGALSFSKEGSFWPGGIGGVPWGANSCEEVSQWLCCAGIVQNISKL